MEERLTTQHSLQSPASSSPLPSHQWRLLVCFLQHVYDAALCAWLSCFIFLFLFNSGKTDGNNMIHMKRKWRVTNKIKLNLSIFLAVCEAQYYPMFEMSRHKPRNLQSGVAGEWGVQWHGVYAKYGELHEKGRNEVWWGWKAGAFRVPWGARNEVAWWARVYRVPLGFPPLKTGYIIYRLHFKMKRRVLCSKMSNSKTQDRASRVLNQEWNPSQHKQFAHGLGPDPHNLPGPLLPLAHQSGALNHHILSI